VRVWKMWILRGRGRRGRGVKKRLLVYDGGWREWCAIGNFMVSLGEAQVLYGIWLNIARTDNSVELYAFCRNNYF
jgi:hypothetical protein